MTKRSLENRRKRPTPLFLFYAGQLAFRLILFALAVHLLATDADALSVSQRFGLSAGFNVVDFVFLILLADFATKFFSRAKIAMGSLKQYPAYHVPTARTFEGGRKALANCFRELAAISKRILKEDGSLSEQAKEALVATRSLLGETWGEARIAFEDALASARQTIDDKLTGARTAASETYAALDETRKSVMADARRLVTNVDFLHLFRWSKSDLTVSETERTQLHKDRMREIVPTAIFWIALNALVALVLWRFGWLNEQTALVWSLFYFVFDMICVVVWCPIQLLIMKNRCCTTCQIFNWDAIMVATPLVFIGGWFALILVTIAIVVLVRWELAAARHPERFDERTNALLQCANCKDELCFIREPYRNKKQQPHSDIAGQECITEGFSCEKS